MCRTLPVAWCQTIWTVWWKVSIYSARDMMVSDESTGEEIDIRGPEGGIEYKGRGQFLIDGKEYHFDKVKSLALRRLLVL